MTSPIATPEKLPGPPPWRRRAAVAGGAIVALGLAILFNAHAGEGVASPFVKGLSTVIAVVGLGLTAASTARATWITGLRWAQARATIVVALLGLIPFALRDGEPLSAVGLLGFVVSPLMLALILTGVQFAVWQPGAIDRMNDALVREADEALRRIR